MSKTSSENKVPPAPHGGGRPDPTAFTRDTDPVAAYRALVQALDEMGEGLMIIEGGRFSFVNDALCRLSGYTHEELLGWSRFERLLYGDEQSRVRGNHERRLAGEQFVTRYETVLAHKLGHPIAVEISISVLRLEARAAAVVAVRDIRDRKAAEAELRQHRDRLQALVEQRTQELELEKEWAQVTLQCIGDAVIATDSAGRVSFLSGVAEQMLGWSSAEAMGRPLAELGSWLDEASGQAIADPVAHSLRDGPLRLADPGCLLVNREGLPVSVELSASPIRRADGAAIGVVIVLHDISERRRLTQKLTHQATHDALTGLTNRFEFEHQLAALVEDARLNGGQHSACYLDLDQFKIVNDSCGHAAGDELLRRLSHSLKQHLRRSDTLARLGGDEFGVLLPGCSEEMAPELAAALLEAVREFQFSWGDKRFSVGASIGVVSIDARTSSLHDVLRAADVACYTAKEKGRNRIHVYQPDDAETARRRGEMQWVSRLNQALQLDRFRLYYQEICPLKPQGQPHIEILLRLREADGALTPPGAFIPAAERYNLMAAVDRWVIRNAVAWYARVAERDPLRELPVMAINLSGTTLADRSLVDFIRAVLAEFAISPASVCFEITETATVGNLAEATEMIASLRRIGCQFALDDFGIGMSSFAYLKNLPVDYLKIDGNFVKDMLGDPVDEAMVDTINRMAQVMGIQTIAEYVENDAIRERLQAMGIDYAQGYGVAMPRALEDFT